MPGIRCKICPHNCLLEGDKTGICGTRVEKDGKVHSLTYGKFSAISLDPIEKKPLYHVHPNSKTLSLGSVGCNLKCPWCQNYSISQEFTFKSLTDISPNLLVQLVLEKRYESVTFTYNEPIINFEYVTEAAKLLSDLDIEVNIVTAGYISREFLEPFFRHITAANVDLKSFNPDTYKRLIKGDIEHVLETLKYLAKSKTWLEITTLIIPGINDSKSEILSLSKWILEELGENVPLHLSAYYPTYKMLDREKTEKQKLTTARNIAKQCGLKNVYIGNIITEDGATTYCPNCNFEIIKRSNFVVVDNRLNIDRCPNCNTVIKGIF